MSSTTEKLVSHDGHSLGSTPPSNRRLSSLINPKLFKPVLESHITNLEEGEEGATKINQYRIVKYLGRGAYGSVSLAIDDAGEEYAIKELSKSRLRKQHLANNRLRGPRVPPANGRASSVDVHDEMYVVRKEIAILKKLHHPNCVKLFEVLDDESQDSLYMVFEMLQNGPVLEITSMNGELKHCSEEQCRDYFQQMVLGFEYLHAHDIVHRDVKPDNLLLSSDNILKIVDFGVSEMFEAGQDIVNQSAGSPAFTAPELCSKTPNAQPIHGKATDIWSMGVTLYTLNFGKLPFKGDTSLQLYENIRLTGVNFPLNANPHLVDLLTKMLHKDPANRIKLDEIRVHPWVTNHNRDPLPSKEENLQIMVRPEDITEEEIRTSIKRISNLVTILKAVSKLKKMGSMGNLRQASKDG